MNTVANIKSLIAEGKITETLRTELKKLGPPRPELVIAHQIPVQRFDKVYCEKFDSEHYSLANWLCGCPIENALFCYICLVMSNKDMSFAEESYYWIGSVTIVDIISKFKLMENIIRHQETSQHKICTLNYALLGENNVLHQLRNKFLDVTQHNEKVRPNHYILSKLIDCVKYTAGESDYKSEMMQVLKENGSLVSSVFVDSFENIWDQLLDSIHAVCVSLIHEEIRQTDFVSLEVDEINSVGSPVKLIFIVRYELKGEIHERFLKYLITQSNHSLNVCNIILAELNNLNAINKESENMISFSYDGLISVFASRCGLHTKIKNFFKRIHFIHSYAHSIDLVIEHTGSLYKELRVFFINLKTFRAFFSHSERYINILDAVVAKRLNGEFKTEWNFQATSPTVITLCSHKSDINACLEEIIDAEVERPIIAEAVALKNLFNDEDFNYWLGFFSKVMPICDELFYQIQQIKTFDAVQVRTIVENFKTEMNYVKNSIGQSEINPPPNKRPCVEEIFIKEEMADGQNVIHDTPQAPPIQDLREFTRTEKAYQVFNVVMAYIEERVTPSPFLLLASLIDPSFFKLYRIAFPRAEIDQATKIFNLDKDTLIVELQILYDRDELAQAEGALFLLHYLYENRLTEIFPETFKLLKIVCTVPITTSEPGRCFSTLKQIKSFLKSSCGQTKSDALTMCLLEKDLMKITPNFNDLVIEHLCKHNKGDVDVSGFTFKQLY